MPTRSSSGRSHRRQGQLGRRRGDQQTAGGIGYVEQAYALQNGFTYASVKNSSGTFIAPTLAAASAAAEGIKVPPDLTISTINSPNPAAYPITSQTFVITYQDMCKAGIAQAAASGVKKFLDYGLGPQARASRSSCSTRRSRLAAEQGPGPAQHADLQRIAAAVGTWPRASHGSGRPLEYSSGRHCTAARPGPAVGPERAGRRCAGPDRVLLHPPDRAVVDGVRPRRLLQLLRAQQLGRLAAARRGGVRDRRQRRLYVRGVGAAPRDGDHLRDRR